MKKILVLGLSDNIGGVETFFHTYYKYLDKKRFAFDFASVTKTIAFEEEYIANGSKVYRLPNFIRRPLSYYRTLKKIMRSEQYDAVHINMLSAANILPIIAAKKAGCPNVIIHSHNAGVPSGLLRRVLDRINRRYLRNCSSTKVACGEKAGEWLFGKGSDFQIIPNAIDSKKFLFSAKSRNEIRKKYGLSDGEILIGTVGRLCEQKNQLFLIDILRKLSDNYKLMIVGSGDLKDTLIKRAKANGVLDRVVFVENRLDIEKYYSAMDLFAFPSLFEGMPIVLIEAQINGLKCFCSDTITRESDLGTAKYLKLVKAKWVNEISNIDKRDKKTHTIASRTALYDISMQSKKLGVVYGACPGSAEPKISVVIPVYNPGKAFRKCIGSLLSQTYSNLDIVIIDDGTTDGSLDFIDNLQSEKKRIIKLFHYTNSGANIARGRGVTKANGDYIMFLDSDDWLENDSIEKLVCYLIEYTPDIIKFNAYVEPGHKRYPGYRSGRKTAELISDKASIFYYLYCTPLLHEMALNLYSKKLFKDASSFRKKMSFGEDYYSNLELIPKADNILFVPDRLYHYNKANANSTTHTSSLIRAMSNIKDSVILNERLLAGIRKLKRNERDEALLSIMVNYMWSWYGFYRALGAAGIDNTRNAIPAYNIISDSKAMALVRKSISRKNLLSLANSRGIKFKLLHTKTIMAIYDNNFDKAANLARRYANG